MSTTWVFIGLLAGRELAIRLHLDKKVKKNVARMVFADLGKVFFGLVVSVVLVFIIKLLAG
jgi:cell division protein FtsL